mmetsp:Transcript_27022/g.85705  ORF Transcript_27022/g.85705 Transcript_27022/m.85705 type:complete len:267 (-) Transcript_27022:508-1308(-)
MGGGVIHAPGTEGDKLHYYPTGLAGGACVGECVRAQLPAAAAWSPSGAAAGWRGRLCRLCARSRGPPRIACAERYSGSPSDGRECAPAACAAALAEAAAPDRCRRRSASAPVPGSISSSVGRTRTFFPFRSSPSRAAAAAAAAACLNRMAALPFLGSRMARMGPHGLKMRRTDSSDHSSLGRFRTKTHEPASGLVGAARSTVKARPPSLLPLSAIAASASAAERKVRKPVPRNPNVRELSQWIEVIWPRNNSRICASLAVNERLAT